MNYCYTDIFGNCPCDNGVMCDKCIHMDVKIVNCYDEEVVNMYYGEDEEEEAKNESK